MNLNKYYKEVQKFNDIAGNLHDKLTFENLKNQTALILEEAKEAVEGAETKSYDEVLDGAVDVFVTLAGLMQQMQLMGYDVEKALDKVCVNNLSKYPSYNTESRSQITEETLKKYNNQGVKVQVYENNQYNVLVFRNAKTGKILKPAGFNSVDLTDCYKGGHE
jgi:phosphoribosyl-ATP pyrophosphohydrolase